MSRDPVRQGDTNYLDDRAIAAYFSAREHEAYYLSLKSVDERRAFHEDLKAALGRLLELADERAQRLLDQIIARTADAEHSDEDADPVRSVRRSEPDGVRLLALDGQLDFHGLRAAYRAAALRYHPDRGGSNEDMGAINRAYEQLHAQLTREGEYEADDVILSWRVAVRTALDYLWSCTRLLFAVALDDWALDEASVLIDHLNSNFFADSSFGRSDDQMIGLIEPTGKLSERLVAMGDGVGAMQALAVAEAGLARAKAHGLRYDPYVTKAQDVVAGRRVPRFVLNHMRQLENAYRLGAIDEKRYEANLARLGQRQAAREEERAEQERRLLGFTFVRDLPVDRALRAESEISDLVPQPGYYEVRAEDLTAEQQIEYLLAYGPKPNLELVKKYAFVRLSGIVRSAVYFPQDVDPEALAGEARGLAQLEPRCAWTAERVAGVLSSFAALQEAHRVTYADELRQLLEPKETGVGFVVLVMPGARELAGSFLDSARALGENLLGAAY
jgi:hypothetical protein